MRNSQSYSPSLSNSRDIRRYVRQFVTEFSEEVLVDCDEMTEIFSSGLVFRDIRQAHVRHAKNTPENLLKFSHYAGRAKISKPFDGKIQRIFGDLVVDPSQFQLSNFPDNLCVPKAMALALLIGLNNIPASVLSMS